MTALGQTLHFCDVRVASAFNPIATKSRTDLSLRSRANRVILQCRKTASLSASARHPQTCRLRRDIVLNCTAHEPPIGEGSMDRRQFLLAVPGGALLLSLASAQEPGRVYRMAVISPAEGAVGMIWNLQMPELARLGFRLGVMRVGLTMRQEGPLFLQSPPKW